MNFFKTALLFICISVFYGCPEPEPEPNYERTLRIINNTDSALYYRVDQSNYPDTTALLDIQLFNHSPTAEYYTILPNSTKEAPSSWVSAYSGSQSGKFMYFLFNKADYDTLPLDSIRAKYLVLKRWDLSLEEMEGINWTLTYP